MAQRRFLDADPQHPIQVAEWIRRFAVYRVPDVGQVLTTQVAPTSRGDWAWALVPVAVAALLGIGLAALHWAAVLVCGAAAVLSFLLLGLPLRPGPERVEICEQGLVLRLRTTRVWTTGTFVIPFATLDPGRIRTADRNSPLPPRHPDLNRRTGTSHGPALPSGGERVVFNALDPVAGRTWDGRRGTPFRWWSVRCSDAAELLADLERQLSAQGFPANGLAARARAQHVPAFGAFRSVDVVYPPRLVTDPVLGVDGPPLP